MKVKVIEKPKADVQLAEVALTSILTNGDMSSLLGGAAPTCGILTQCGKTGKNSCQPYSCGGQLTSCTGTRTWVTQELEMMQEFEMMAISVD